MLRSVETVGGAHASGPITRLISPEGLGQRLKPFVFLDHFKAEVRPGFGFPMHPHSGIATLTWQLGVDVDYVDTTGKSGRLPAGGLEWMNAGGGTWHQGVMRGGRATGFQLWVPMPPEAEEGPSLGVYVPPDAVPTLNEDGVELRLLLGRLERDGAVLETPIPAHQDMTYAVVFLQPGAAFRHSPPAAHRVAFAFVFDGEARIQGAPAAGPGVQVLGPEGDVTITAGPGGARVLFGTARPHDHDLVLGYSSIHTTPDALERSLKRIEEIGRRLPAAVA